MATTSKHIVITGATAGIGRSSALHLAKAGARLTLLSRNPAKAEALAAEVVAAGGPTPGLITMDMASLASVRVAAEQCLALNAPIDILLNNAGVVNTSRRVTVDGFEETLAVNHLAPFLLTGLLLPAMETEHQARIVNVASDAHSFVRHMRFEDMQAEESYKTFREYGRSKLANILFTRELAKRLDKEQITVNCLHPGAVATSLGSQNDGRLAKWLPALLKPFFRSPDRGASTSIYLCESEEVNQVNGAYFVNCRERSPKTWAQDDSAAARLWQYSEEAVGFSYPDYRPH